MYALAVIRYRAPIEVIDAVRDGDPFWRQGLVNYELLPWNPVVGREGLDRL